MDLNGNLVSARDADVAHKTPRALIFLVLVASIGGFLFGYDTGVVSGAMLEMKEVGSGIGNGMSTGAQEAVVSSTVAAAAIGSAFSGIVQRSSSIGRRTACSYGSALFAAGAVVMGLATEFWQLIFGRIIVGLAVGIASQVVPIYIAEVAPSHLRGALNVLNNVMIVFGQVAASAICCAYANRDLQKGTLESWRWMLGWGAAPAVGMFFGLVCLPESPRWLLHCRRDETGALAALTWLRGSEDLARTELAEVSAAISSEVDANARQNLSLGRRLTSRRLRKALLLGVGLQLLQQCVGVNTIMYYSATILQMGQQGTSSCSTSDSSAGGLTDDAVRDVCYTIPIASCQLVGNLIGMFLADRGGRRPLTLSSLFMVFVSLCALGYSFYPDKDVGWLALGGMCMYLLAFGVGMSPMPWVVNAEIYPLGERSIANSIATSANWVSNFVVSATFLDLAKALSTNRECPDQHPDGAFFLYAGIALLGLIVLAFTMPETSGKTLEQMDELFEA